MTLIADAWVPGQPKTKGSLNVTGAGYASEGVAGSVRWRCLVAERLREWRMRHGLTAPHDGPVLVDITCWLPVPKTLREHVTAAARAGIWTRSGDVDKLARNVLDALSTPGESTKPSDLKKFSSTYIDDTQVHQLHVVKYGAIDEPTGARVRVFALSDQYAIDRMTYHQGES